MDGENKWLIPVAIIVAGLLVAGALFYKGKVVPPTDPNQPTEEIVVAPISASDHVLGSPNAPITIIEFSDIDCPFCQTFHATMEQITNEYGKTGQVAWVYRHFPLDQLHPNARTKAESTECVASLGGNDAFWTYLKILFERTDETLTDLPAIAASVGVDQTAFNTCVTEKRFAARVVADSDAAMAAGGRGTPYSIILTADGDEFPVNGAQPYEVVKQVIDTILASQE
ncbi:MAG: thioredoxin domain-containing protein [Patescibacteria group bacterium]